MQTSDNFAAGANTKPLYNRLFGTEGHEFLSANRTFWVDADDGSDTTGGGATVTSKYQVLRNSYLDTGGRGTDWVLGGEGTSDETSVIQ